MFFHGNPSPTGLPSIRRSSRNTAMNWPSLMLTTNGFSGGAAGTNEFGGTPSSLAPWQSAQPPAATRYTPYSAVGPSGGAVTAPTSAWALVGNRPAPKKNALALGVAVGDRHREAALHNNLADLLHAAGRREEAMAQLKQAVVIFAEIGMAAGDARPEIWKLTEW